jgi:hypothetical protein
MYLRYEKAMPLIYKVVDAVVATCGLVETYRRFSLACCINYQSDNSVL